MKTWTGDDDDDEKVGLTDDGHFEVHGLTVAPSLCQTLIVSIILPCHL